MACQLDSDEVYDDLNGVYPVRIARRLCGDEVAAKLARDFGGTRTYFPKVVASDHPLARSLGQENAQKIASECWGIQDGLYIPFGLTARDDRRALVAVMVAEGLTVREIARRTRRGERTISSDIAALRAAGFKIDPERHRAPKRERKTW